ncbi:polysaccharide pyruvyl transferase family protein [Jiella sonneratiae]|uniref:Polysaccharide pyruvyl transferase family protein n=1 Tax=Jiella sonneratiae TaxID=2816856 RepID=A0ABS3J1H5_9HYPH|nr:polysaccharide pyruvyl transferase family protein [Jiella sonneratiae]
MAKALSRGPQTGTLPGRATIPTLRQRHLPSLRQHAEKLRRRFIKRELNATWASLDEGHGHVNFGDALSPLVVSAISGRRIRKLPFVTNETRLSAIGTIAQNFSGGDVQIWGSGLDRYTHGINVDQSGYRLPSYTRFTIAACRGRHTRQIFLDAGVASPEIFGDPGFFVGKLWPQHARQEKIYDVGVIPHLSEWAGRRADSPLKAGLRRYEIPSDLAERVVLISPIAERSFDGVGKVIEQIGRCRRILSASLHGLVVAEALGVPAFPFGVTKEAGPQDLPIVPTHVMDHRIWDLYSVLDRKTAPTYCWPRQRPANWHAIVEWCDRQAPFFHFDPRPLFDAFPYRKVVRFDDERWPVRKDLLVEGDFL